MRRNDHCACASKADKDAVWTGRPGAAGSAWYGEGRAQGLVDSTAWRGEARPQGRGSAAGHPKPAGSRDEVAELMAILLACALKTRKPELSSNLTSFCVNLIGRNNG